MVKLTTAFSQIQPQKVLVIGDLLLDTYTIGKVGRISPEAPVPVLHVEREEHRPGGSGNVVLNLIAMGAQVVNVGRVGDDACGALLSQIMEKEGVDNSGIVVQQGYPTPVKNRIIASNQQIVRVDHEETAPIPEMVEQQVIERLPKLLEGVKIVAISDYGKGFLSHTLLANLIDLAHERKIPVITDPKGIDFTKYRRTTLIKPNLSEAYTAANLTPETALDVAAERILEQAQAEVLMVTRSEEGISLFYKGGKREDFPVRVREVNDVTGAGDTVLATLTCAMANGLTVAQAAQLANLTAGLAIEHFGCAQITLSELARRLLEEDVGNKVFGEDHLFALQEALRGHCYTVLGISGKEGLTSSIFRSIRQLKEETDRDLLLYIRDPEPDQEFVTLLASLHEVDFIILKSDSLANLCSQITPEKVYLLEGETLVESDPKLSVL